MLLFEANNKGNLIFQHLELFVLDSKAISFFQVLIPEYFKEHNSEEQHQTDLVFVQSKILVLDSDIFVSK